MSKLSGHIYRRLRLILAITLFISFTSLWVSQQSFKSHASSYGRVIDTLAARDMQSFQEVPTAELDLCRSWTSEVAIEDDPSNCLRAIKYRQVERLSKDLLEQMTWSDKLRKANVASVERLKMCLGNVNVTQEECPETVYTVIVGSWWWWDMALTDESESGETVWMRTTTRVLQEEGYTLLSCSHWFYDRLIELHHVIPDVISYIWAEDRITVSCIADPRCVEGHAAVGDLSPDEQPGNIPLWKLFTLTYWGARPSNHGKQSYQWGNTPELGEFSYNPLGNAWTISPWEYPGHTYIPLSIERECTKATVVPQEERKDQALVLAKLFNYFYPETFQDALDPDLWKTFEDKTQLVPIGTAGNLPDRHLQAPEGLHNLGSLSRSAYDQKVAESKVLLGIGRPEISPSPYSALCQGVPVVVPYYGETPTPEGWDLYHQSLAQHGPAASLGEPYVYSYHYKNTDELYEKLERAKNTPIDRYIPPGMTHERAHTATLDTVERDWQAEAQAIISTKLANDPIDNPLAVPEPVIARCFKLGTCVRLDVDGKQIKTRAELY